MLSNDLQSFANVFTALGEGQEVEVILTSEQFASMATTLQLLADRARALEQRLETMERRLILARQPANVIPFSKPWGGNPPGSHRGPGGGGSAA